jgi:hypothetical protein
MKPARGANCSASSFRRPRPKARRIARRVRCRGPSSPPSRYCWWRLSWALVLPRPAEIVPVRAELRENFRCSSGEWTGRRGALEGMYLDQLKLDDYLLADYESDGAARSICTWPITTRSARARPCIRRAPACPAAAGSCASSISEH